MIAHTCKFFMMAHLLAMLTIPAFALFLSKEQRCILPDSWVFGEGQALAAQSPSSPTILDAIHLPQPIE